VVEKSMALIFHFIYRMSSFPLTNSYFSRWLFNHQPDMDQDGALLRWFLIAECLSASAQEGERNYHIFYEACDGLRAFI
jgi:hypothetical protein